MAESNSDDWWATEPADGAGPPEVAGSVRESRIAVQRAGVALALWRTHRGSCDRCKALVPPAGPAQACYRGGPLLARLLAAQDRAGAARRALAAVKVATPGRLF